MFAQLFQVFKTQVDKLQLSEAEETLAKLKTLMLDLDSLPPLSLPTPNAEAERAVARQVLEYAVILAVALQDKILFQKNMSALRPYYTQLGPIDLKSDPITAKVIGLNLLYLLVENRLSDFHCELELLTNEARQEPAITFCTKLEQHLVVGSYDEVLSAAAQPPTPIYSFFLNSLLETVRLTVGECLGSAYQSISVPAAITMLKFETKQDIEEFISDNYPTWRIEGNKIYFESEVKAGKSTEIPSIKLIEQTLSYATELERIV